MFQNAEGGLGLVQNVEMKARGPQGCQPFAELSDNVGAEGFEASGVVAIVEKALFDPAGDFGSASLAETEQTIMVGNRHDARINGNSDALLVATVEKVFVGVGVEKVLGNGFSSSSLNFAFEVNQVVVGAAGFGVNFGVGSDDDLEGVAVVGFDELDKFVGVVEFVGQILSILGQVAAQGDEAVDANLLVTIEQGFEGGGGVADAREMGNGGETGFLVELEGEALGAISGGSASAIGDGEEAGLVGGETGVLFGEVFEAVFGFWGKKFEAYWKIT